jgi:hypothetical protein
LSTTIQACKSRIASKGAANLSVLFFIFVSLYLGNVVKKSI